MLAPRTARHRDRDRKRGKDQWKEKNKAMAREETNRMTQAAVGNCHCFAQRNETENDWQIADVRPHWLHEEVSARGTGEQIVNATRRMEMISYSEGTGQGWYIVSVQRQEWWEI
jgi:hypothetical protein